MVSRPPMRDAVPMFPTRSARRLPDKPGELWAAAPAAVRILLVEDHGAVAHRLRALLNWQTDVHVCEIATAGHDAVIATQRLKPEVCLVSEAIGPAAALRLTDRLKRLPDPPHVLLYAEAVDPVMTAAGRLAGADAVIARDDEPTRLTRTIAETAAGTAPRGGLQAKAPQWLADMADEPDRPIIMMLLLDIHPDDVARTLGISSRALRSRRQQILYQLDEALALRRAAAHLAGVSRTRSRRAFGT